MQAGGMDGIEVEAYGHLFDQFLSPFTNHRHDEWGGDADGLLRFPLPVLGAIRERVGPDFIVGVRMVVDETLPVGIDTRSGLDTLARFEREGLIDVVNVIRGTVEPTTCGLTDVIPIHGMASAPHLDIAGLVRAETGLAGAPRSRRSTTWRRPDTPMRDGLVDIVGMTRAHLADPHIVRKIQLGVEHTIRPCVGATYCLDRIYQAGEALCLHNAATGRELSMPHDIEPAGVVSRRVMVIGAGPGGSGGRTGVRRARAHGHGVRGDAVGRRPDHASPHATRDGSTCGASSSGEWPSCARLGVDGALRHLSSTPRSSRSAQPDVVIVATGGQPQLPELEAGADLVITSVGRARGRRVTDRRRAVLRRQRHALGAVGGRADRPLRRPARDRHAGAHVRHRGGRHEPRAVRAARSTSARR
jgi:hypothetical protein